MREKSVKLTVGRKVNYPAQGPCLVGPIVKREVAGTPVEFHQLVILDERGGTLFIPVDSASRSGLRMLLKPAEIPAVLASLTQSVTSAKDWKQRARVNSERLASGSARDLVEVVESLTALSEQKSLSIRESWMLEKAMRLLVSEISEVTKETRASVADQVRDALKQPRVPDGNPAGGAKPRERHNGSPHRG
jgi:CarD family transcriptional regulator